MVICGLTACTQGSAPGPTLGIEYGKPLPLPFYPCSVSHQPPETVRSVYHSISGWMPFLTPNQQCRITTGKLLLTCRNNLTRKHYCISITAIYWTPTNEIIMRVRHVLYNFYMLNAVTCPYVRPYSVMVGEASSVANDVTIRMTS